MPFCSQKDINTCIVNLLGWVLPFSQRLIVAKLTLKARAKSSWLIFIFSRTIFTITEKSMCLHLLPIIIARVITPFNLEGCLSHNSLAIFTGLWDTPGDQLTGNKVGSKGDINKRVPVMATAPLPRICTRTVIKSGLWAVMDLHQAVHHSKHTQNPKL